MNKTNRPFFVHKGSPTFCLFVCYSEIGFCCVVHASLEPVVQAGTTGDCLAWDSLWFGLCTSLPSNNLHVLHTPYHFHFSAFLFFFDDIQVQTISSQVWHQCIRKKEGTGWSHLHTGLGCICRKAKRFPHVYGKLAY